MNVITRPHRYVGKLAKVRSLFGGYSLPQGVPENVMVRIVDFEIGHFTVEFEGHKFVRVSRIFQNSGSRNPIRRSTCLGDCLSEPRLYLLLQPYGVDIFIEWEHTRSA